MTAEATATFTAREFNRDVSAAKRAAADGPVIVTDRGRPAYVLLEIDDYRRLTGQPDEEPSGEELVKQLSMSEEDYVSYVNADFRPGFLAEHLRKDLGLALMRADDLDLTLPGAETAFNLYDTLCTVGGSRLGTQAISLLYADEQTGSAAGLDWSRLDASEWEDEPGCAHDHCDHDHRGDGHGHYEHDHCGCGHHHGEA